VTLQQYYSRYQKYQTPGRLYCCKSKCTGTCIGKPALHIRKGAGWFTFVKAAAEMNFMTFKGFELVKTTLPVIDEAPSPSDRVKMASTRNKAVIYLFTFGHRRTIKGSAGYIYSAAIRAVTISSCLIPAGTVKLAIVLF
jgi:hypothetical protein